MPSTVVFGPDRRPAGHAFALDEKVCHEEYLSGEMADLEFADLPRVFMLNRVSVRDRVEHEVPAVLAARCADLPEVLGGHGFEDAPIGTGRLTMKNRLACEQLPSYGWVSRMVVHSNSL